MLTKWQVADITQDMRDNKQIFVDWLKHAVRIEGRMKAGKLAKKAGVDPGTISKYLNGHSLPRDVADMIKICKVLDADYEQIIIDGRTEDGQIEKVEIPVATARFTPGETTTRVHDINDPVKEHISVVKQFENKPIALAANKLLLDLERSDQFKFIELVGIMKKFANGATFREVYPDEQQENPTQGKPKLKNGTNNLDS